MAVRVSGASMAMTTMRLSSSTRMATTLKRAISEQERREDCGHRRPEGWGDPLRSRSAREVAGPRGGEIAIRLLAAEPCCARSAAMQQRIVCTMVCNLCRKGLSIHRRSHEAVGVKAFHFSHLSFTKSRGVLGITLARIF